MDNKYIIRALSPLKSKIHLERAVKLLLYMLFTAGFAALILATVSLFVVIPFVRIKMLAIITAVFTAGVITALFLTPSLKKVIIAADSLGLEERVVTSWYLKDDNSPVSLLQREDTKEALRKINLKSAYKIKIPRELFISVFITITAAFLISFIPGKVADDTRLLESLINEMKKQEEILEKELEKQVEDHPGMSEEQLEEIKAMLEKLKEEFDKAKSEEDALKALARLENQLEKLKEQNPLQDLKALENALAGSPLTENLGNALKSEDEEALKDALDKLMKELENTDNREELSELLKQAAQSMPDNSMMAEALEKLASLASGRGANEGDIAQSLKDLIAQAMGNASDRQDFMQAAGNLGEATKRAKLAVASVDRYIAQGSNNSGNSRQGGQGQGSRSDNQGRQPGGQGQGNQAGNQGQGGQNGNQGQGNLPGNQGQGQSNEGGAGAGSGSTNEDAGYNEGDQSGSSRSPGGKKENEYRSIYIPERLGGEGNESLVSGQKLQSGSSTFNEADGAPVQKGVMLPWNEVLSEYREEAVQSMERQDIPAGLEMLVRDYFSSLE